MDMMGYLMLVLITTTIILLTTSLYIINMAVRKLSEKMLISIFMWFGTALYLTLLWTMFEGIMIYYEFASVKNYIPIVASITLLSVVYYQISRKLEEIAHTFGHK